MIYYDNKSYYVPVTVTMLNRQHGHDMMSFPNATATPPRSSTLVPGVRMPPVAMTLIQSAPFNTWSSPESSGSCGGNESSWAEIYGHTDYRIIYLYILDLGSSSWI